MPKKSQHAVPHQDGWAVKREGKPKVTKVHDTQKDAISHAKEIAKNQESQIKIYSRDGKIRDEHTYGKGPYPPKG